MGDSPNHGDDELGIRAGPPWRRTWPAIPHILGHNPSSKEEGAVDSLKGCPWQRHRRLGITGEPPSPPLSFAVSDLAKALALLAALPAVAARALSISKPFSVAQGIAW